MSPQGGIKKDWELTAEMRHRLVEEAISPSRAEALSHTIHSRLRRKGQLPSRTLVLRTIPLLQHEDGTDYLVAEVNGIDIYQTAHPCHEMLHHIKKMYAIFEELQRRWETEHYRPAAYGSVLSGTQEWELWRKVAIRVILLCIT